jgi:hypothetical protein
METNSINNPESISLPPSIPTPPKNIYKSLFFIFLGLFIVVSVILVYSLVSFTKTETPTPQKITEVIITTPTPTPIPTTVNDATQDWKTYENKEVGLSFKYPSTLNISEKLTNGLFTLTINNKYNLAGGINATTGITTDRGGSSLDFSGYIKSGNQINICDSKLVQKIYTNPNGLEIVLVGGLNNPNEEGMLGFCETTSGDIKGLVNTKSKIYPGMAFITNSIVNESDLLKILDTLKLL